MSHDPHEPRPPLDRWLERVFGDPDPGHLGSGWTSGTASVFLGGLGLLAVLVLWFPAALSTPQLRSEYPLPVIRVLIAADGPQKVRWSRRRRRSSQYKCAPI